MSSKRSVAVLAGRYTEAIRMGGQAADALTADGCVHSADDVHRAIPPLRMEGDRDTRLYAAYSGRFVPGVLQISGYREQVFRHRAERAGDGPISEEAMSLLGQASLHRCTGWRESNMGKTLVAQTAAFDWETAASLGVDRSEWHRQVTNVRAQVIQQPTGRFNLYLIAPKDVPASVPDGLTILQGSSLRTYAYAEGPQGMRLEPSVDIIAQWQEILDRAMDLEQSTAYLESLVD